MKQIKDEISAKTFEFVQKEKAKIKEQLVEKKSPDEAKSRFEYKFKEKKEQINSTEKYEEPNLNDPEILEFEKKNRNEIIKETLKEDNKTELEASEEELMRNYLNNNFA